MDWQIFLLYLQKTQNKEKLSNWWDAFKTLPLKLKVVFSIYFTATISMVTCFILSYWFKNASIGILISILTIVILAFILNASREDIKNAIDRKINQRQELFEILKSEGIIKKNQIKQLYRRLPIRLNKHYENNQKITKYITTSFQILIIPFLLMIMSNVFSLDGEFEQKLALCFVLLLLAVSLSIIFIMFFKEISFINYRRFNDLELFLSLLQDILDFEFEIEDNDIL